MPALYPFDIAAIRAELATAPPLMSARWLRESWGNPDSFLSALCEYHAGFFTPAAKSSPISGFDFYFDAVIRHASGAGPTRIAMHSVDSERGVIKSLSYADLHAQAGRLAALLRERGVKPGTALCWVLPLGEKFLICLAAALRIGAVGSFVLPLGERYVAKRLQVLKPALLLSERLYQRFCPEAKTLFLEESGSGGFDDARSHTYGPAKPVLTLFSPLFDPPDWPLPVLAPVAYLRALRDGLCIYGLRPGDGLAAPGFDVVQHQPALLLSTLLCGATFVHMEPAALEQDAALLNRLAVTCLGIGNATRDALRKARPTALPRLQSFFRQPLWPAEFEAWRDLCTRHGLGTIANLNVHVDAAQGGAQFFSSRHKGGITPFVLPAPGAAWSLLATDVSGQKAPGHHGVFLPEEQKKESAYLVLSRATEGYFVGGTRTPRRAGQVFPAAEVIKVVAELPWVVGASTVAVPEAGEVNRFLFILLVFVGGHNVKIDAGLIAQIEQQISFLLSPEHLPDYMEIYPLYPRRIQQGDKRLVDAAWCQTQYLSGMLHRKVQRRSAQLLTTLRKVCTDLYPE